MSEDIIEELNVIVASMEDRVMELEKQLKDSQNIISQQAEEIRGLTQLSKVEDRGPQVEKLLHKTDQLRSQLIDITRKRDVLTIENNQLFDTVKVLESKVKFLEDSEKNRTRNDEAYAVLSMKLSDRDEQLDSLHEENDLLSVKVGLLLAENRELKSKIATTTGDNDALSAKISDLQAQLSATAVYCKVCGEYTVHTGSNCYQCIERILSEHKVNVDTLNRICALSSSNAPSCSVNVCADQHMDIAFEANPTTDEKMDTPRDVLAAIAAVPIAAMPGDPTDNSTAEVKDICQQCLSLKELSELYQDIIEKLTAQLSKVHGLAK